MTQEDFMFNKFERIGIPGALSCEYVLLQVSLLIYAFFVLFLKEHNKPKP
jgi:hypothetical protein